MNNNLKDKLIQIALDVGLINYIDNETPRHYFIRGDAELDTVLEFAEAVLNMDAKIGEMNVSGVIGVLKMYRELAGDRQCVGYDIKFENPYGTTSKVETLGYILEPAPTLQTSKKFKSLELPPHLHPLGDNPNNDLEISYDLEFPPEIQILNPEYPDAISASCSLPNIPDIFYKVENNMNNSCKVEEKFDVTNNLVAQFAPDVLFKDK